MRDRKINTILTLRLLVCAREFDGSTISLARLAMLSGRSWLVFPTLALAGSLARKRNAYVSQGALPTHAPLFAVWLIIVTLGMGAMNCPPALPLGPFAEHLLIFGPPQ